MTVRSVVRRSRALVGFCARSGVLALRNKAPARGRDLLPPVTGAWPKPDGRPVVFAAADSVYFERFAGSFLRSVLGTSPGARLHLHCFDPDLEAEATLQQWTERWPERLSFTAERVPEILDGEQKSRVIYYQAARFVRIAHLVEHGHRVLGLDIDCLVRDDLTAAIGAADDADIGLFLRRHHLDPGKRVLAACFLAAPTRAARLYLHQTSDLIGRHLLQVKPTEKLDQLCLYWAYLRREASLRVWQVPHALADWHMDPTSVVWMAKGARKHNLSFVLAGQADPVISD